jgi:hypothetical protein
MAGAGYTTFTDGQVLTAAQVNTYLMQQSVMVFATAAARTTALPSPSEGMITYRSDDNVIEYYDGAAWQPILDQDVIAAKGDLIVGTGDDTVSRLAVGSNTQVLTADSTTATGLKWAAAAGKIINVVTTAKSDTFTTTSDTLTDITGLSVSITPTAASSTILIIATISGMGTVATNTGFLQLVRGSTSIAQGDTAGSRARATAVIPVGSLTGTQFGTPVMFVDSPSTTSSTTYKFQVRRNVNSGTVFINRSEVDTDATSLARTISTITAIEIGA